LQLSQSLKQLGVTLKMLAARSSVSHRQIVVDVTPKASAMSS
jgi:hypothetical protein